jgi:hypothetical protein
MAPAERASLAWRPVPRGADAPWSASSWSVVQGAYMTMRGTGMGRPGPGVSTPAGICQECACQHWRLGRMRPAGGAIGGSAALEPVFSMRLACESRAGARSAAGIAGDRPEAVKRPNSRPARRRLPPLAHPAHRPCAGGHGHRPVPPRLPIARPGRGLPRDAWRRGHGVRCGRCPDHRAFSRPLHRDGRAYGRRGGSRHCLRAPSTARACPMRPAPACP